MPWGRERLGNVRVAGLVHMLYEWRKDDRVHWDTQCYITWETRNNTNETLRPATIKRRITCLRCLYLHLKHGWPL